MEQRSDVTPQAQAGLGAPDSLDDRRIMVVYYTDPLCCWSWALEPEWQRFRRDFADRITWRYRMGGLIRNWQSFSDPLNSVGSPAQMAAYWYQVKQTAGVSLDEAVWEEDPPASSYPACIAFKAAELQGPEAAERYLLRLRKAAMLEGRNIARRDVLRDLAYDVASDPSSGLEMPRFEQDLASDVPAAAFREDLMDTRYRDIGRFPALIMEPPVGRAILMIGYRPYDALASALAHVAGFTEAIVSGAS